MNEGFKKYYGIGQRSTRFASKNYKNLLNYYAFLIMEVIACITIIPIPILILAKVELAKKVRYEQPIHSLNLFSIKNKNGFKQLWLTILLLLLHYLSRVILIFLAGGFCFLIGLAISYYINQGGSSATKELVSYIIIIILTLPATIVHLVYTVYFVLSIAPISFIIASSENMTVTQAIQCGFQAMKQAKGTLFFISLVYAMIYLVIIGLVSVGIFICVSFVHNDYIQLIICILISLIGFYIIARFMMSNMVARYSLFEDLVRNTDTKKIINHIKFSRYKGNYKSAEKNKIQMFDDLSTFDGHQNQLQETPPTVLEISNQKVVTEKPIETTVAESQVVTQEEPTPVVEPQVVLEDEPTPVAEPQVVTQEEPTPVVEPQVVLEDEPAPVVEPHVVLEDEPAPVAEPQVVLEEEPTPVVEPQVVLEEEPAPVVEPQVVLEEEPAPVAEPQGVTQEEPTPVVEPQVVLEEEPTPVEEPQVVTQEEPKPVIESQEEIVKPKRGRKPKTVKIEEETDTPKKTVRKTSTRTKKSKVDGENSSDALNNDTKGDN